MLNFAINNETAERANSLPFLTFHPSEKEMNVMAKKQYSRKGMVYQGARIPIKSGQRFGRLTVIKELPRHEYPSGDLRRKFLCECDCGKETEVLIDALRSGRTKSCGCYNIDQITERNTKHGYAYHPLSNIFGRMVQCCENPNNENYKNYGGRGITVCDEWRNDSSVFYDWAINNGWKKGLLIDRINNDTGYSPSNCRFVGYGVSARNKQLLPSNNKSGYRGVHKCFKKWRATITLNDKRHDLGLFDTPEEAACAYDAKAKELNAEHPLNFPDEVTT